MNSAKYKSILDSRDFYLLVDPCIEAAGFEDVLFEYDKSIDWFVSTRSHTEFDGNPYQFRIKLEEVTFQFKSFLCATVMVGLVENDGWFEIYKLIGKFFYIDGKWQNTKLTNDYKKSLHSKTKEFTEFHRMHTDNDLDS